MGTSKIDNLIAELQKAEVRVGINKAGDSGPPSLPTVENGQIGIWRTVKRRRTFIELEGPELAGITADVLAQMSDTQKENKFGQFFDSQGRVKEQYRDRLKQTRVLKGPGDLVGHDIGNVPSEAWSKLNPDALEGKFRQYEGDSKSLGRLRSTIEGIAPDLNEKGRAALSSGDPVKIANVGINSGMTTEQVEQALAGKSVRVDPPAGDGAENVVSLDSRRRLKTKFTKPEDKTEDKPKNDKKEDKEDEPEKPTKLTPFDPASLRGVSMDSDTEGALALVRQVESAGPVNSNEEVDKLLSRLGETTKDKKIKDVVEKARRQLERDFITPEQAYSMVKEVIMARFAAVSREAAARNIGADGGKGDHEAQDRMDAEPEPDIKPSRLNAPEINREDIINDRAAVQEALEAMKNMEQKMADFMDEAKGDRQRAQEMAAKKVIEVLNSKVKSPRVRIEAQRIQRQAANGSSPRTMMLALIQLLRLILTLLLPGG